jgi:hypothetical protein
MFPPKRANKASINWTKHKNTTIPEDFLILLISSTLTGAGVGVAFSSSKGMYWTLLIFFIF